MELNTVNLKLDEPVTNLAQVSSKRGSSLDKLGIKTVRDLVYHFPRRYLDLSHVACISDARVGRPWTIAGKIENIEEKEPKPGVELIEITIVDDTGTLIVTFFRQKHILKIFGKGDEVVVAGELIFNFGFKRMTNPFMDHLPHDKSAYDMAKILSIYPTTAGLSVAWMRNIMRTAIDYIADADDFVPTDIVKRYRLMHFWDALNAIHFPKSMDDVYFAKRTLKYCEILLLQLELISNSESMRLGASGISHDFSGKNLLTLQQNLKFELTSDQQKAICDILNLMSGDRPSNHLLLGDVGTGKTLIAAMAIAACVDSGYQALIMAPTEILVNQHSETFANLFANTNICFETLTSSTPRGKRQLVLKDFSAGKIDVLVGTHSLINDDVVALKLGLIVIDEQHRFGVEQRTKLVLKGLSYETCPANKNPCDSSLADQQTDNTHIESSSYNDSCPGDKVSGYKRAVMADVISMSATPIPRTLCLAMYGDKTTSFLTEVPTSKDGINPRTTKVLHKHEQSMAYDKAFDAMERGEQVFVICPLVGINSEERNRRSSAGRLGEMSTTDDAAFSQFHSDVSFDKSPEAVTYEAVTIETEDDFTYDNPKAAVVHAKILQNEVFTTYQVDVIHAKLPADEKKRIMQDFKDGKIDVLVSTTIVEVGVDIPNATVMIIEDADRFGLSQLHQLRGRVGRGDKPANVFLISTAKNDLAINRLKAMETCSDGSKLAEMDLAQRREGDIFGNRQHGTGLLKLIQISQDKAIIETAHKDAIKILGADPKLTKPENLMLRYELSRSFLNEKKENHG